MIFLLCNIYIGTHKEAGYVLLLWHGPANISNKFSTTSRKQNLCNKLIERGSADLYIYIVTFYLWIDCGNFFFYLIYCCLAVVFYARAASLNSLISPLLFMIIT